jgi:succinate dehydrogenase/fumarate reductase flavoprotein subunit
MTIPLQSTPIPSADARAWAEAAQAKSEAIHTEVLVLGAGMAGLRAAVRARSEGRRVILAYAGRGASPFIIGCNAPFAHTDPEDTPEQYAKDVLAGGYGLSDEPLIKVLTENATRGVRELASIGASIARDGERFQQRQLSGNWYARSVFHPDGFGPRALSALSVHAASIGVKSMPGHRVVRLIFDRQGVCGALLLEQRSGVWRTVLANAVVMALGGLGQLYEDSTYPSDIAASAYGLGYEAGAQLVDMEFVQFEPLCTFAPKALRGLEMPTSMLAEGAHLLNAAGERFMFRHNPQWGERRIEKAKLSLFIQQEIDEGRGVEGGVVYDATRVAPEVVEGYGRHCKRLRKAGLDPSHLKVLVRPAAHSQMGGIWIDSGGATSVPGLYAAGEAAGGVHGASRIAGNGGADALVFGDVAGGSAALAAAPSLAGPREAIGAAFTAVAAVGSAGGGLRVEDGQARIRTILSGSAGLYRSGAGLQAALKDIDALAARLVSDCRVESDGARAEAFATLGMARTARAVMAAALVRTESRGAHQRRDYPETDDGWRAHVVVQQDEHGHMSVRRQAVR